MHIGFEGASLARRDDEAERFHQTADLVRDFGLYPDKLGPSSHQRSCQHAIETLDPNFTVEANPGQMREPIRVVGVGFVGGYV